MGKHGPGQTQAPGPFGGQKSVTPAVQLLELVTGITVVESGAYCCGIAGTYGLKKEKYDIAMLVGKPVFDKIVAVNEGVAACDSETCRWQIEQATSVPTVHPIAVNPPALGLSRLPVSPRS